MILFQNVTFQNVKRSTFPPKKCLVAPNRPNDTWLVCCVAQYCQPESLEPRFFVRVSRRSVPGAGLHDLSRRVGRRGDPGHVRRADGEILTGRLLGTLGLYAGHHGHPGRPHPVFPGLRPGKPADRLLSG